MKAAWPGRRPTPDAARSQRPDDRLLDAVQRAGFGYFWDHAHPVSRLARDRSTRDVVTSGGTGMGLMVLIIACERGFVGRREVIERINAMLEFLARCERHHGHWGHFHDGVTGRIVPFSAKDDGADLVETALLAAGLLALREYFAGPSEEEQALRQLADRLWQEIDWAAHRQPAEECLFWHWSPRFGFAMNHRVTGWNECLIAYVLAAGSPAHTVPPTAYHRGLDSGPPVPEWPRLTSAMTCRSAHPWAGPCSLPTIPFSASIRAGSSTFTPTTGGKIPITR